MDEPVFEPRERFETLRGQRGFVAAAAGLWSAGRLDGLERPCIAIVGTRAATAYGKRLAHRFALELGTAGCCIVSGLALGIDSAAHRGALEAGAPTVAVLGSGHRQLFPSRNAGLAGQIVAAGGAVLSPYPPDHPAYPSQFLARNGVVAALADALVVVEAPARSGALNTASWAAGRMPVLAVPGDVDRAHVAGCLALIRDGATLVRHPGDVLEALGADPSLFAAAAGQEPERDDPLEAALIAALASGACELDDLAAASHAPAADVLAALTRLELAGAVERSGPQRFAPAAMLNR
jgi:DNA processing protein